MATPEEVPWGGAYGTTGPDTGYAMRLVRRRTLPVVAGEDHHDVERAIVAIAGARASHYGRAPIGQDVDVAMTILGYHVDGVPADVVEGLRADRSDKIANLGHDAARERRLVTSVPLENLVASPDDLRRRLTQGERLIDW